VSARSVTPDPFELQDIQAVVRNTVAALAASPVRVRWCSENTPTVAVFAIANNTGAKIDFLLETLVRDIQIALITWGGVQVIDTGFQSVALGEIRRQYKDGFDQSKIAGWGKLIGPRYVIDGVAYATRTESKGIQRQRYYFYMRVLDVETGALLFQSGRPIGEPKEIDSPSGK